MKELVNMLIKENWLVLCNTEQTKLCVQSCLNLLYRRLLLCEVSLLSFSENVCSHHKAVIPNLIVLNSCMYKDLCVLNSDDQHCDLQLGLDSLSNDECDSDDSLVSLSHFQIKDYGPVQEFWLFNFEWYNGILCNQPSNNKSIEPTKALNPN